MNNKKCLALSIAAAAGIGFAGIADAARVVYENAGFISGEGSYQSSFAIAEKGRYRATLTDYRFGDVFELLGFSIKKDGMKEIGVFGEGTFEFSADVGTYYTAVFGNASDNIGLGLYGVQISLIENGAVGPLPGDGPSPVPAPAAIVLFASAMAGMVGFAHRRREAEDYAGKPAVPV